MLRVASISKINSMPLMISSEEENKIGEDIIWDKGVYRVSHYIIFCCITHCYKTFSEELLSQNFQDYKPVECLCRLIKILQIWATHVFQTKVLPGPQSSQLKCCQGEDSPSGLATWLLAGFCFFGIVGWRYEVNSPLIIG